MSSLRTLVGFCNFSSWPLYISEVRLQLSMELAVLSQDPSISVCQKRLKSPYSIISLWKKFVFHFYPHGFRRLEIICIRLNSTPRSLRMKVVLTAVIGAETFLLIKNTTARCGWYDTTCIVAHDVDDMQLQILKHRCVNNLFCVDMVEIVTQNENSNNMCKSYIFWSLFWTILKTMRTFRLSSFHIS